jgi:hypothetical protein
MYISTRSDYFVLLRRSEFVKHIRKCCVYWLFWVNQVASKLLEDKEFVLSWCGCWELILLFSIK